MSEEEFKQAVWCGERKGERREVGEYVCSLGGM